MKKLILALILLLSSLLYGFKGKVYSIHDGDTITVATKDGVKHKIRLSGIDSPEVFPKQEYGLMAKKHLSSIISGREVEIVVEDTDQYGRTVGEVFYRGESMNVNMVKNGYAWHYWIFSPNRDDLREEEIFARNNKIGLWKGSPIPPWEFREKNPIEYK
ncbi:MAG: thermonuclease family protein [Planktothrix sp.]